MLLIVTDSVLAALVRAIPDSVALRLFEARYSANSPPTARLSCALSSAVVTASGGLAVSDVDNRKTSVGSQCEPRKQEKWLGVQFLFTVIFNLSY
ncbi:hypothetical protein PC112_g1308 [Phytophthora cactorum]|nr:hypothetical protein PC112_g1308 [Phytophthora cactorum]